MNMSNGEINLDLDRSNEITFSVDIESSEPLQESPHIRFLINNGKGVEYGFQPDNVVENDVSFNLNIKNILKEGMYSGKLEVIIGDKYFCPIEIEKINCSESIKVVAEAKVSKSKKKNVVSASIKSNAAPRKQKSNINVDKIKTLSELLKKA